MWVLFLGEAQDGLLKFPKRWHVAQEIKAEKSVHNTLRRQIMTDDWKRSDLPSQTSNEREVTTGSGAEGWR